MIIDVTGIELIPGNHGKDCPGNGMCHALVCCCDECDYVRCCIGEDFPGICRACDDRDCPRRS